LKELPPDVVRKDFEFWDAYVGKLKGNPEYAKDYDAQRSFSKLRASTGNIYRHRKMDAEAEQVYRQALELWPGNGESLNAINSMLWDRGDFDGVLAMLQPALDADPNNIGLWQMYFIAEKRKELQSAIAAGEDAVAKQPASAVDVQKLLELYASVGDTNKVSDLLGNSIPLLAKDAAFLKVAVEYGEAGGLPECELAAAKALVAVEPEVAENQFALARAALRNRKKEEFFTAARAAVEKGGLPMREALAKSTEFDPVRNDPEFQAILGR
jgi:tetratricopeptide (TPR) repeat protein